MGEDEIRRQLYQRIATRRASIGAYVRHTRPRTIRLANISIVSSSLAAVLTAGPAFGGESFSGNVQSTFGLASDSYVWRSLCLGALLVSLVAAISTNLSKSQDNAGRLSAAEACGAELEGLQAVLEFGQLSVPDAVTLYHQYTAKIPFVEDRMSTT